MVIQGITDTDTEYYLKRKRAWKAVSRAVASGRLVRPDGCPKCKRWGVFAAAHHSNYDKPLDVTWLCTRCHKREHAGKDIR